MRAFLSSTVAACAALLLLAPATADAGPALRLKIEHTSEIFQFDPSIEGTGPLLDAVVARVQLRHCPVGEYSLHLEFIQDGISYELTPGALGRGEITCDATGVAQGGWAFMGNGLHPGTATVIAFVEGPGDLRAESTRTVRIPAGYHQP